MANANDKARAQSCANFSEQLCSPACQYRSKNQYHQHDRRPYHV